MCRFGGLQAGRGVQGLEELLLLGEQNLQAAAVLLEGDGINEVGQRVGGVAGHGFGNLRQADAVGEGGVDDLFFAAIRLLDVGANLVVADGGVAGGIEHAVLQVGVAAGVAGGGEGVGGVGRRGDAE